MEKLFLFLFWISLSLCISTYLFYPLLIYLFSKLKPVNIKKSDYFPSISIIISAYNEEKYIEKKILNTLNLDYPQNKIEIIIGSDGSTDKTVEISKRYISNGIKVLDFNTNQGKVTVQNKCVEESKGEILVFMDAASAVNSSALLKIVRNFKDKRVGCVAGRLEFINKEKNITTRSQGIYWKYEFIIRKLESDFGQMIGVDGPLYAIKKESYFPFEPHIISDLMSPLLVLAKGEKVVLETEALVEEEPTINLVNEFNTRRRITLRGLVGIFNFSGLLNPFRNFGLFLQIVFHKLIRWFVGILTVLNLISSLFLYNIPFFNMVLMCYALLLLLSCLGYILNKFGIKYKIFIIPYYFVLVNFSASLGVIDFFMKKKVISWNPVR